MSLQAWLGSLSEEIGPLKSPLEEEREEEEQQQAKTHEEHRLQLLKAPVLGSDWLVKPSQVVAPKIQNRT